MEGQLTTGVKLVPGQLVQKHHGTDHFQAVETPLEPLSFLLDIKGSDFGNLSSQAAKNITIHRIPPIFNKI